MRSQAGQLRLWITTHQRWFALGAIFSVFSLMTLFTGDKSWLGCMGFLGFLGFLGAAKPQRALDAAS